MSPMPRNASIPKRTPRLSSRLWLLAACIIGGGLIGYVGQHVTGSSAWFLAVPGLIALAWLFVADPDACLPDGRCRRQDGSG